jgi:hypothetical protein
VSSPNGRPVFGFRSNWGKFDDAISTRIRWPRRNRFDDDQQSTSKR